jgi:hypothetical protein
MCQERDIPPKKTNKQTIKNKTIRPKQRTKYKNTDKKTIYYDY